ncbi:MAG TPA: NAD(P)-binding domain-containing protein, partial [Planctomycetaceae bacterium]
MNALQNKTATVGVVGLGYVGLPLANLFHQKGFQVVGFDIDKSKVNSLNAGRSYIGHIPNARIIEVMGNGRFIPTTDFSKVRAVDTVSICVPTPLDDYREP